MIKNLLFAGLTMLISVTVNAQCTEWLDPAPPEVYLGFGYAPCSGGTRTLGDEVYKSEGYLLAGVQIGDNFTFNICSGDGAGAWIPDFTILAPSGAVDNFGTGDGDGCSITWTATEAGEYKILINEEGNCGIAGEIDNGYPEITTNIGGIACPEFLDGAESFETTDDALPACWQAIDADGDGFNWAVASNQGPGVDGDKYMSTYSYDSDAGALTPDNYLITPQVTLGVNDSLYYAVRSLRHKYSDEVYRVLVSTTGTAISDFTDEVLIDTLLYVNQWQSRTVNLSAYAGQTIYLAFRHTGTEDLYGFLMDAVKLPGTVNCNPDAVTELDKVESSLYPNPANNTLNITSSLQGAATVRVFDALGRVVLKENVNLSRTTYTQNISSLENGIYTIQISTTDKVATQRFVKQ